MTSKEELIQAIHDYVIKEPDIPNHVAANIIQMIVESDNLATLAPAAEGAANGGWGIAPMTSIAKTIPGESSVPDKPGRYRMSVEVEVKECPFKRCGWPSCDARFFITVGRDDHCMADFNGASFVKLTDICEHGLPKTLCSMHKLTEEE